MPKIIIAPDSFKETLTAVDVAHTIEVALKRAMPDAQTTCLPLADGGEGTVETLVKALNGQLIETVVQGPLGGLGIDVCAQWGLIPASTKHSNPNDNDIAIIDVACASGLALISKEKRNPSITTTYGTGQLIAKALDMGVRDFIIGLGGSATNDAGTGLLRALGLELLDQQGAPLPFGAAALANLHTISTHSLDPRLVETKFWVACDVDNPLLGDQGASAIYGPQKGASQTMVKELDVALEHFANLSETKVGKAHRHKKGAGAAGGVGFGLMQYTNAQFRPGIDLILDYLDFDSKLKGADFVITGEGRLDAQSLNGKAITGVAKRAKQQGIPVIALAGSVELTPAQMAQVGIDACFSIVPGVSSLSEALANAELNLDQCAYNIAQMIKLTHFNT